MQNIQLTNTFDGKKTDFIPIEEGKVSIYSCGPTVYDYAHIGNFRSFLMSDILFRVFEYAGYDVTKVQNITDVGHLTNDDFADSSGEDKIAKKAIAEKKDPFEIARYYEDCFVDDEAILRILPPNGGRPRATEFIPEQIALTKTLIDKGFAYEINGSVYFRAAKFDDYGKLSGNKLEDLQAGARVEINDEKESPLDFALWKSANENHLMQWDFLTGKKIALEIIQKYQDNKFSEKNEKFEELRKDFSESYDIIQRANPDTSDEEIFGILQKFRGFPGWHIECSAMSQKLLGDNFDIHTGGEDNIFPHHECEIAQNKCGYGGNINYWLHGKHLLVEGKKMSKSKGNFYTIRDLLEKGWHGNEIRLALMKSHYRSALNFSEASLTEARANIKKISDIYKRCKEMVDEEKITETEAKEDKSFYTKVEAYKNIIFDDLHVGVALAKTFEIISFTTLLMNVEEKEKELWGTLGNDEIHKIRAKQILYFLENHFDPIFNIFPEEKTVSAELTQKIEQKIAERKQARADKNWALSDQIRDELACECIELIDEAGETRWEIKS